MFCLGNHMLCVQHDPAPSNTVSSMWGRARGGASFVSCRREPGRLECVYCRLDFVCGSLLPCSCFEILCFRPKQRHLPPACWFLRCSSSPDFASHFHELDSLKAWLFVLCSRFAECCNTRHPAAMNCEQRSRSVNVSVEKCNIGIAFCVFR